ncbi:response regulator [bacterium]|nr:response regulator [bacterium]
MADRTWKVLLADDEVDVHTFVKAALSDDGYDFCTATDGEAALQLAREQHPDLIILDVQMPKKTGFDVFSELRRDEATRGIPVIMLTAVSERVGMSYSGEDMGDFYGSEPEAFIDKPIEASVLRDTARKIIQDRAEA